jgi:hypothetical protein
MARMIGHHGPGSGQTVITFSAVGEDISIGWRPNSWTRLCLYENGRSSDWPDANKVGRSGAVAIGPNQLRTKQVNATMVIPFGGRWFIDGIGRPQTLQRREKSARPLVPEP